MCACYEHRFPPVHLYDGFTCPYIYKYAKQGRENYINVNICIQDNPFGWHPLPTDKHTAVVRGTGPAVVVVVVALFRRTNQGIGAH